MTGLVDRIDRVVHFSDRVYRDAVARPLFGNSNGHPQLAASPPTTPYMSGATVSSLVDAVDQLSKRLSRLESAFVVFESTFHEHFARGVAASAQNYRTAVQEAMEPLRQSTRQHGAVLLDLVHTVNHLVAKEAEAFSASSATSGPPAEFPLVTAALTKRPQESHGPKYSSSQPLHTYAANAEHDGPHSSSASRSDIELQLRIDRLKILQRDFLLEGRSFSAPQDRNESTSGDNAATSSTPLDVRPSHGPVDQQQTSPFRHSMVPLYTTTTSSSATSQADEATQRTNPILRNVRNILRPAESSDSTPPMLAGSPMRGGGHVTFASDVPGVLSDVSTTGDLVPWRSGGTAGYYGTHRLDYSSHSDAYQELVHRLEL
jgi:hypothetical protein